MYDENYPIAVLIEELRNEDVQFRLNSIKKLSTIAIALGPEKTRSQLIPFLTESVYDEDDVLVALTEQLIKLIPHIGGPSQIKVLLPLLETLGTVEETVVREKAVQVLRQIAPYFSYEDMIDAYFPLVQRFATAQWFATKISAAALFSVVYPRVDETQRNQILDMVVELARDEYNTVRTAVATKLSELALTMLGEIKLEQPLNFEPVDHYIDHTDENADPSSDHGENSWQFPRPESYPPLDRDSERSKVLDKLIPVISILSPDENDTVRLMAFESAVLIAKGLAHRGTDEPDRYLIKMIHNAATDKFWRVRCILASKFPIIFEAFGRKIVCEELYSVFINLLKDAEPEVRVVSVSQAKTFAYLMAGTPMPPDLCDEGHEPNPNSGRSQTWTGMDASNPLDKLGGSGIISANNAITLASTLLSCGETTLGSQLKAIAVSSDNAIEAQAPVPVVSADTDNFIFKFNSLSDSLSGYKNNLSECPKTPKNVASSSQDPPRMDVDESVACGDSTTACSIIMRNLIPTLKELQMDSSAHVRITLANTIMYLVPLVGPDVTLRELMPIIVSLLKDECQEVRLNLIVRFEYLTDLMGMDIFTSLLMPIVKELATDRKWRVRLGIMDYLLLLAEKFEQKFFTEEMMILCLSWLIDHSYAIRLAAVINISKLAAIFGEEWTREKLIPNIMELANDENYLHRMICIQTLMSLSEVISTKLTQDKLVPCVLKMADDKVPNVRFKVAQSLSKLGRNIDKETLVSAFKPVLYEFTKDPDNDVQFYARETAENLGLTLD